MESKQDTLRLLLSGLAAGDCLGTTTEFAGPAAKVVKIYERYAGDGWPFRQVGGGPFGFQAGGHSDDTAMALRIAQAHLEDDLTVEGIGSRFVRWMLDGPPDIGDTTRAALQCVRNGEPAWRGGLAPYRAKKTVFSNGSLMRNGVVPGLKRDRMAMFTLTVGHSIITHWPALPVLLTFAHSYLIREFLEDRNPLGPDRWYLPVFDEWEEWTEYVKTRTDADSKAVKGWMQEVPSEEFDEARELIQAASWNPATGALTAMGTFDPHTDPSPGGYCLFTLQVAVWAAKWSMGLEGIPPVPDGYPNSVYELPLSEKHGVPPAKRGYGPNVLAWVVMVGKDADTYGATAGPLLAAIHGYIPENMLMCLRGGSEDVASKPLDALREYDAWGG